MRGLRTLLVLIVVLGGLVGYIYFIELKKPAGGDMAEVKAKAFTVTADKVQDLSIRSSSGERTVLKKSGSTWTIVEPEKLAADEAEVSGLTAGLASLEIQRIVDEKPGDLKQYGLAEPKAEVAFKTAEDKDFRRILFGDKTATGGDMYARLGHEPKVFLVSAYLESTFNRSMFDLRNKTILSFDRAKADSVEVIAADKVIGLSKSGEDWKLVKPVAARTDFGSVEGLVSRLQTAQMKSIVKDPKEAKEYALDKPEIVATVGAGSARATLEIGKASPDGTRYARDVSRPLIFTVEAGLADDLKKGADDYRRKDLFEFRSYNANRVDITRGTDTFAFEKSTVKSKDGKSTEDKWRMVKPEVRDVDSGKMDTLLSKLSNLRAQSFTDPAAKEKPKTGLESPAATVAVKFDENRKEEKVTFGRADPDVYAARPDEVGAARLLSTDWDDVVKALDDVKQKVEAKPDQKQDKTQGQTPK